MNLNELAVKHGSDKRGEVHDYARLYEQYLHPRKNDPLRILEIGVFGGSSLKMWRDFFPNAHIVGVDINPDSVKYAENRVSIEIGDQSNKDFLKSLVKKYEYFDIIIDDGSHATAHHVASFEALKHGLRGNGFYIIEDLHTCYWPAYSQGMNSIDKIMVPLIHDVQIHGLNGYGNYDGPAAQADESEHGYRDAISKATFDDVLWEYIHFYKSIVFIKKR